MNLPISILIILGISLLLISVPFVNYKIVRDPKLIKASFITSAIIAIIGLLGILKLLYRIETLVFSLMFGPILFFSIYQILRFVYKKDTGREPVSTYASSFDYADGRGIFFGDYIFNFLLLVLTLASIFGLNYLFERI